MIIPVMYLGVDINEQYIRRCKQRYNNYDNSRFIKMDLLEDTLPVQKVDVVVASGAFCTAFDERNVFIKKMLRKFYDICSHGFVFNMENSLGMEEPPDNINYDPVYWLNYIMNSISHKIQYYSDYHDSDFTIAVRK